jgi:hypothetical protein
MKQEHLQLYCAVRWLGWDCSRNIGYILKSYYKYIVPATEKIRTEIYANTEYFENCFLNMGLWW